MLNHGCGKFESKGNFLSNCKNTENSFNSMDKSCCHLMPVEHIIIGINFSLLHSDCYLGDMEAHWCLRMNDTSQPELYGNSE